MSWNCPFDGTLMKPGYCIISDLAYYRCPECGSEWLVDVRLGWNKAVLICITGREKDV